MEPQVVMRNKMDVEIKGDRCMYNDLMPSRATILCGTSKRVEVIDWISETEMVFESYNCSIR